MPPAFSDSASRSSFPFFAFFDDTAPRSFRTCRPALCVSSFPPFPSPLFAGFFFSSSCNARSTSAEGYFGNAAFVRFWVLTFFSSPHAFDQTFSVDNSCPPPHFQRPPRTYKIIPPPPPPLSLDCHPLDSTQDTGYFSRIDFLSSFLPPQLTILLSPLCFRIGQLTPQAPFIDP